MTTERFLNTYQNASRRRARMFLRTSRASCWPPTPCSPRRRSSPGYSLGLSSGSGHAADRRGVGSRPQVLLLSEKYAEWADSRAPAKGFGIHAYAHEVSRPIRLTDQELRAHDKWRNFGHEIDNDPPMRGWLAVLLIGSDGANYGFIQASDRLDGEFTEQDEANLVRLEALTSTALDALAQLHLPDYRREVAERSSG
jgi:hypothetical protein